MTAQELHWIMVNRSLAVGIAVSDLAEDRGWLSTIWKDMNFRLAVSVTAFYVDWKVSQR